jgi:hypothetical protein
MLQFIDVVIEFLCPTLPLLGAALPQIRVISLPELFIGGSDIFNKSGATDDHEKATMVRSECEHKSSRCRRCHLPGYGLRP